MPLATFRIRFLTQARKLLYSAAMAASALRVLRLYQRFSVPLLQRVAAFCSVLQRVAVCCSVATLSLYSALIAPSTLHAVRLCRVLSPPSLPRSLACWNLLSPFPSPFSRFLKLLCLLSLAYFPLLVCEERPVEMKSDLQKWPSCQKRPIEITKCMYKKYARRSAEASLALIAIMRAFTWWIL